MSICVYILNKNYGNFIARAINSVINQTFDDFEIIIIDDASIDNSDSIIKTFKNQKIKQYIKNPKSLGLVSNANLALSITNKKYIVRLDADDYLFPKALEKLFTCAESDKNIGLVYGNYNLTDIYGNILKRRLRLSLEKEVNIINSPCHGACTLFKTEALRSINGYNDKFDRQDGVYAFYSLLVNGWKVKNIKDILFNYTQHPRSLSQNQSKLHNTRALILEDIAKKYFKKDFATLIISIYDIESLNGIVSNKKNISEKLKDIILDYSNLEYIKNIILIVNDISFLRAVNFPKKVIIHEVDHQTDKELFDNKLSLKLRYIIKNYKIPKNRKIIIRNIEYPQTKICYVNMAFYLFQILTKFNSIITVKKIIEPIMINNYGGIRNENNNDFELHERSERYLRCGGIMITLAKFIMDKRTKNLLRKPTLGIEVDEISSLHITSELNRLIEN